MERENESGLSDYERWTLENGELDLINRLLAAAVAGTIQDMRTRDENLGTD